MSIFIWQRDNDSAAQSDEASAYGSTVNAEIYRHRGQHLNFTQVTSGVEELTLTEKINYMMQVPEDFHSFVHSLAINDPQEEPNSI